MDLFLVKEAYNFKNINMAIDFFEIGRSGASRTRKIDYSKALDPLAKKIETRVKESKAKTEALINSMPQGVAIDKVPEELRGQVTDFLAKNKKEYVDASRVIASGIRPTDQRYIDAMSTINGVNNKFQNLSNQLEDIALKRQAALDGRDHSKGAFDWEISDHEGLAYGSMYASFSLQDDGSFNYLSNDSKTKKWSDYSNTFQTSSVGQEGFDVILQRAKQDGRYGITYNKNTYKGLFKKLRADLKTDAGRDFLFSDEIFLEEQTGEKFGTPEYEKAVSALRNKGNFENLMNAYEKHALKEILKVHKSAIDAYDDRQETRSGSGSGKTENNQASIEAARRGDKIIKVDNFNVAVQQKDGYTYKIVKNNEASLNLDDYTISYSQDELIKFFGGKMDSDMRRFKKLEDTLNKQETKEKELPAGG